MKSRFKVIYNRIDQPIVCGEHVLSDVGHNPYNRKKIINRNYKSYSEYVTKFKALVEDIACHIGDQSVINQSSYRPMSKKEFDTIQNTQLPQIMRLSGGKANIKVRIKPRPGESLKQLKERAALEQKKTRERVKKESGKPEPRSHVKHIFIYTRSTKRKGYMVRLLITFKDQYVQTLSARDYKKFKEQWNKSVDKVMELCQLQKAPKGWRTLPMTEGEFERAVETGKIEAGVGKRNVSKAY